MTRSVLAVSAVVVLAAAPISAQRLPTDAFRAPAAQPLRPEGESPGAPLTLSAAVDEALANNPRLLALRREYAAIGQRPAQQRFLAPPTFEAEIWQWPLTTVNPLDVNMYMFSIRQEIPGRGKRALRVDVAQKDVERAANDVVAEARNVIAQVKRAYADLLLSRRATDIYQHSETLLRQTADMTTVKYTAGRGGQADVLKVIVEISRLRGDLITYDERAQTAEAELNALLNRPLDSPIGSLSPVADQELPSLSDVQGRALTNHPEVRAARIDVAQAQAALAVTASDYRPDFMVGGGYQLMPRTAGAWTGMVGMTWPNAPWSRGALDAKKAEAAANVVSARARQQAIESQVRLAVQQAYVRVTSAASRASLMRTSVLPASQQTIEVARVAYQNDRGDVLALIDTQRTWLEAQLEYDRALTDLDVARADLEHAVGEDLYALPAIHAADRGEEPGR